MALSDITLYISNNAVWIVILIFIGYSIWKFIIQPRINEGKPIRQTKQQLKEKEKNRFKFEDIIDTNSFNDFISVN